MNDEAGIKFMVYYTSLKILDFLCYLEGTALGI